MKKKLYFIIILFIIFSACNRNKDKDKENKNLSTNISNSSKDSDIIVTDLSKPDSLKIDSAQFIDNRCPVLVENDIPSPADFEYAAQKTKPNFSLLFSITNNYQLQNTFQKSFILGIYSTDLVYSTVYGNGNLATKYFNSAMKLSDELGISNVFTKKEFELIKEFEYQDSISIVIKKSLETICIQLNESKTYNELPFIIYGGWLESVYLLSNVLISNPDAPKKLHKQLSKQKETIVNLIDFFNNILVDADDYETNLHIQNIIGELEIVRDLFENSLRDDSYIMNKEKMKELISILRDNRDNILKKTEKKIEQQQIQYQKSIEK